MSPQSENSFPTISMHFFKFSMHFWHDNFIQQSDDIQARTFSAAPSSEKRRLSAARQTQARTCFPLPPKSSEDFFRCIEFRKAMTFRCAMFFPQFGFGSKTCWYCLVFVWCGCLWFGRPEETRRDQKKPEETRRDQKKPEETRRDKMRLACMQAFFFHCNTQLNGTPGETRRNQMRPEETR